LIIALTLAAAPVVAALVAPVLMWCLHEYWPEWVVAVLGGGLFVCLMCFAWRLSRRTVERHFRFSIREMFAGIAVIAVLLATLGRWWLHLSYDYGAIHSVNAFGGYVEMPYDHGRENPNALHSWIGYDPFETHRSLSITSDRALAEVLERPNRFVDVSQLSFGRGVTSAGFVNVGRLNQLTDLRGGAFYFSRIDASGLERLSQWTNARSLFFNSCPNVTDAGLAHLVGMPKLENLSLIEEGGGMVITDAGLSYVGQMKGLKTLMLLNLKKVTDAGLVHLQNLSNLEDMSIHRCAVTAAGLQQLCAALPDCRIIASPVVAPGPQNVRRIIVRKIAAPNEKLLEISDAARIAEIVDLIETTLAGTLSDYREEPWPASFELSLMGKSRRLYQVRIGDGALQSSYRTRWNEWIIDRSDVEKLIQLISIPVDKSND
jgi:hypothetical protein